MDIVKPAWQYIGEMREEGVVWFDRNPHAFPLGTRYYALTMPQDTSTLEALIAKAGEVMRERCAHEADPFELKNAIATDIAKGIRALPGVKLEDLQK